MTVIRIYDLKNNVLAFDLRDIIRILAPVSLEAIWRVSAFLSANFERFEAIGVGGEQLEKLAQENKKISGHELEQLASNTVQVIWGEFTGSLQSENDEPWVIIRAIDSTFYEIKTSDEAVIENLKSNFVNFKIENNVR